MNMSENPVLAALVDWAERREFVRAMILTGSRANSLSSDQYSDYDVILVVQDISPLVNDKQWIGDFGRVLVAYWDPVHRAP